MQRVAPGRGVVFGERGARLEWHAGDTVDVKIHRDHVIGDGEGRIGRSFVAEVGIDRRIERRLVPHQRRAWLHRVFRVQHERQHLVVDVDRLGGVERLGLGLCHHHGDRLADMARLVRRKQHVRTDEQRAPLRRMQLHVEFCLRQRIMRDRMKPGGETVGAAERAEHARHRAGAGEIDAANARMRVRRAHDRGVALPRRVEVIAKAAGAGRQPRVLLAGQRMADETKLGGIRLFHEGRCGSQGLSNP